MSTIKINGTKAAMQLLVPKVTALMRGQILQVDENTSIQLPDLVGVEVTATPAGITIKFDKPLPLSVTRGWGPFKGKFSGDIEAAVEITPSGAKLVLGSLPDQVLEWSP